MKLTAPKNDRERRLKAAPQKFVMVMLAVLGSASILAASPLTSLEYKITGTELRVSPAAVTVPKGIAGSVLVEVVAAGSSTNAAALEIARGAHVEAVFRGPSFPARRLVGKANEALLFPPLNLVGNYQLDDIKLVDDLTGVVRLEGNPRSVPVQVFDDVLVSRVTSRPLTLEEIQEKGIVIDELNFRVVEFEVVFVLRGGSIPVRFPVVSPQFKQSTEIIPAAELEERLAEAQRINQEIASRVELPPELETAGLNIQIQGVNFEEGPLDDEGEETSPPPITGILVIPGHIGFLNQFFSVQIFTENAAPLRSGLSVNNVRAELVLPPGADQIPAVDYAHPGDDPLRFARLGPDRIVQRVLPVVRAGPDEQFGTDDDITRLHPREGGEAEFFVEGLKEGLHVLNLNLTADLEGLAAGTVRVSGRAAGSVLVRNPKFSLAFAHPRTVRFGEPYEASVTILNTSDTVANLVSVSLSQNSLSGVTFEPGQEETVQLGNLAPGQSATAVYRLRAQRTGFVSFSNLTTSDDSVQGAFRLFMGVDERGVALSSDSIGMPDYVNSLPPALVAAAQRVLGQALSGATAGRLPAGVKRVALSTVTRRVLDLAEAGQRLRYGDQTNRVLVDLLLDWQGARQFSEGFDQIIRETDAGREWREALMVALNTADARDGLAQLFDRASDLAGRGEAWNFAAASVSNLDLSMSVGDTDVMLDRSGVLQAAAYRSANGDWLASAPTNGTVFQWRVTAAPASVQFGVLLVDTNGGAQRLSWSVTSPPAGAVYRYALAGDTGQLLADLDADGLTDAMLNATRGTNHESAPAIIRLFQDLTVKAGRPVLHCYGPPGYENYGTVLSLLFTKPMRQSEVNVPASYVLDNGVTANSVQVQPGGRVALLNLREGIGTFRARSLQLPALADARGNVLPAQTLPVELRADFGIALRGRVIGVGGNPVPGIPVTLTMHDSTATPFGCVETVIRTSQQFTDADGGFTFDFVSSGMGYTISATDTSGLTGVASEELIQTLLEANIGNTFNRTKLETLAREANLTSALLETFNAGDLRQAVVKAEGLDRAVFRDFVANTSSRLGTEVPVVLRFRGRGVVLGRALAADGVTPLSGAAVNLFPDQDSRELGRGVFADTAGNFAFFGVPLGLYSLDVQTGDGRRGIVSGFLERVGQTNMHSLVIPDGVVQVSGLQGIVLERDGVTPHPGARVFVGDKNLNAVASAAADGSGLWAVNNVPVGDWIVFAISADGRRQGRRNVTVSADVINFTSVQLQGLATVTGQVTYEDGAPAVNAQVAGGEMLVHTDAEGRFTLTGVPTGQRRISAGIEAQFARDGIARIAGVGLEVLPGIENIAVIRLPARGRVTGRVFDPNGVPLPNLNVALPSKGGFSWVTTDAAGRYRFDNQPLGDYLFSAPAPPVKPDAEAIAEQTIDAIRNAESEDAILAAVTDAFTAFVNISESRLRSEPFNPNRWGYARTGILFDGHTATADIHLLPAGTIAGRTVNAQGVGVGASVVLRGLGPGKTGAPELIVRGSASSDAGNGSFAFRDAALAGPFELNASSPLFTSVATQRGETSVVDQDSTNNILRFASQLETGGRLTGFVLNPDGTSAGGGVSVHISFAPDYVIHTDTNGFFDTQIKLPANMYSVTATNLLGIVGRAQVAVRAGITNTVTVQLLDQGHLSVEVRLANGEPATNATVNVMGGSFPHEEFNGLLTDAAGRIALSNIYEGRYAVDARQIVGATAVAGRAGVTVLPGQTASALITLAGSGTVRGVFLANDRMTPVTFAQVQASDGRTPLGFAGTDANGRFEMSGLPLTTILLQARNQVSGRLGQTSTALRTDGSTNDVTLIERDLGEVTGFVIGPHQTNSLAGVEVTLNVPGEDSRKVMSGVDGSFSFPGTPAGQFSLRARDPISLLTASAVGLLPEQTFSTRVDLILPALGSISGLVLRPDGVTPATNVSVEIRSGNWFQQSDTDTNGQVNFANLTLGSYSLTARSLITSETRSVGKTNVTISVAGEASPFTLTLPGVGSVGGQVFLSDGSTLATSAEVKLNNADSSQETTFTDVNGQFAFNNVPRGEYQLTATRLALAAKFSGMIHSNAQNDSVTLTLGASGVVQGRLVRASGSPGVANAPVIFTFASQSGLPGRAQTTTTADGGFTITNIPVGQFTVGAVVPHLNGLVLQPATLSSNGQVLHLGDVRLDEAEPDVESVTPPPDAVAVPVNTTVEVLFTEPIAAASLQTNGFYLRSFTDTVAAALELLPHPGDSQLRLVRLTPASPLASETTYELVILSGERRNALGDLLGSGPTDLVGRPLPAAFRSSFTTVDSRPPELVSISPTNNETQIDPRAVMRLVYDESLRPTNFSLTLTGLGGAVGGQIAFGPDLKSIVFTPDVALLPNATYTVVASDIRDQAGNLALHHPLTNRFHTLDTLGPGIAKLQLAGGVSPVAASTVALEAHLEVPEPGARVRFTADLNPIGVAYSLPFQVNVNLPASGTVIYRAIATDRYGNDGALAELIVNVVSNQLPLVTLTRHTPTNNLLLSGQNFTVVAGATDDAGVTNINLLASGAFSAFTNLAGGPSNLLALAVPASAIPGAQLQLQAQAADVLGLLSSVVALDYLIADGTAPTLSILSPSNDAVLNAALPLEVVVAATDNSTNLHLQLELSGALVQTQMLDLALSPGVLATNTFSVSLTGLPQNGATLTATLRVSDAASNAVTLVRDFTLPDTQPPRLLSVSPTNGATRQSLWLNQINFEFDENLAASTVDTNTVSLTNNAGLALPYQVARVSGGEIIQVQPLALPLPPGVTFTNTLLPAIADGSGNPWVDQASNAVPVEGLSFTLATAAILGTTPTNLTPVIAGQSVGVTVNFEPGLGATSFRFTLSSNPPVTVNVTAIASNVTGVVTLATNALDAVVQILAQRSGASPYPVGELELDVRSYHGDEDGDKLPNWYEIAHGFDPFTDDAASNPDNDGLTTLEEFQRGTDPRDPDSDDDSLTDGQEVALGGCLDPLDNDSDNDGLLDGADPNPCAIGQGIVFEIRPQITLTEGTSTNFVIRAVSDEAALVFLGFEPTNSPPLFAHLGAVMFTNSVTNGLAEATLTLSPGFDAAGVYSIALRSSATNGASGITNLTVTVLDDPALQITRWKDPVSGNWSDAAKWTEGVPDATRIAVIDEPGDYGVNLDVNGTAAGFILGGESGTQSLTNNGQTLTLSGISEIRRNAILRLGGGSITGGGQVSLGGQLIWSGGNFLGSGLLAVSESGLISLLGPAARVLGRSLANAGEWRAEAPHTLFIQNTRLGNLAGGVMNLDGVSFNYNGGTVTFTNEGTINVMNTNLVTVEVALHNRGQINLGVGRLRLASGGTETGTLEVPAGATWQVDGDYTALAGSVVGGAGRFVFAGGSQNFGGLFLPTAPVTFASGTITISNTLPVQVVTNENATVNFHAPQWFDVLAVEGGSVQGSGDFVVTNRLVWTGGNILGSAGVLRVESNAVVTLLGPAARVLGRSLANAGEWRAEAPHTLFIQNTRLGNLAGGVMNLDGVSFNYNGGTVTFTNEGTISVMNTNLVMVEVALHNRGQINLGVGRLRLASGGTETGTLEVPAGATWQVDGDYTALAGSVVGGAGRFVFAGGSQNFGGLFLPTAPVTFASGTITISNTLPVQVVTNENATVNFHAPQWFDVLAVEGGSVQGSGDFVVTNRLVWTGGNILGSAGVLRVESNAVVTLLGPAARVLGRSLANAGEWRAEAPHTLFIQNTRLGNLAGGVMNLDGVSFNYNGGTVTFTNEGTINVMNTNLVTVEVALHNRGQINLGVGRLRLASGGTETGTLEVPAGATWQVDGDYTALAGSVVGGAGRFVFAGGSQNFGGLFLPTAPVTFASGTITISNTLPVQVVTNENATVNFHAPQWFDVLAVEGGSVQGSGDFVVTNRLVWTGGNVLGGVGAVLRVESNAVVTLLGPAARVLGRSLANAGEWRAEVPHTLFIQNTRLGNLAGGVMNLDGVSFNYNGGTVTFTNEGTINVMNTNQVRWDILFNNFGAVLSTNGILYLPGGSLHRGPITLSAPAVMILDGTSRLDAGGAWFGDGTVRLRGPLQLTAPVNFGALTVVFEDGASLSGAHALANDPGGTLIFSNNITVPASLTVAGTMTVGATNITVTIAGTLTLEAGATLNNPGTVRVGAFVNNGGTIIGNAPLLLGRPLQIVGVTLGDPAKPRGEVGFVQPSSNYTVALECRGEPGRLFVIESSADLKHWESGEAVILETSPGHYRATVNSTGGARFFRLRSGQ